MIPHITVSNDIQFEVRPEFRQNNLLLMQDLRRELSVPNPEYIQAKKMGRWTGRINEYIRCYNLDRRTNILSIPRGYWDRLKDLFRLYSINATLAFDVVNPKADKVPQSQIKLRDYQVPAVEAAVQPFSNGVIVAPPGAGKTELALEVLVRLGFRALWITNKQDLAVQARDRAVERLDMKAEDIGMIGGGEERLGDFLTIGMVQTLSRRDLTQWEDYFGLIVVDECHHVPASTWNKVVNAFKAGRRFGLTGTLERQDGLHKMTHLYLGPTVHEITADQVKDAGGIITPQLRVVRMATESEVWDTYQSGQDEWMNQFESADKGDCDKPFLNRDGLNHGLFFDPDEYRAVVERLSNYFVGSGNLILTSDLEHASILDETLNHVHPGKFCTDITGGSSASAVDSSEAFERFAKGDTDILFVAGIPHECLSSYRTQRLFVVAGGWNLGSITRFVRQVQQGKNSSVRCYSVDIHDPRVSIVTREANLPYNDLITDILTNEERNNTIIDTLAEMCPGHYNLVLSSRIDHCMTLNDLLQRAKPELRTVVIHHESGSSIRRQAIQDMRDGLIDVMFAVDIPKEGLDIPRLDRIYLTAGGRDPIMIKQSIGRIQRAFDGKEKCLVIDFVDYNIGVLQNQHYARRRIYREMSIIQPRRRGQQQMILESA